MSNEPSLTFRVERRWKNPPPLPAKNDWELIWSFDDLNYAQECVRDETSFWATIGRECPWEFRIAHRATNATGYTCVTNN